MEMEFRIVSRVLIGYLLAITPLFAVSTVKFGIKAGCNDYILKPFTSKDLREKIQTILDPPRGTQ